MVGNGGKVLYGLGGFAQPFLFLGNEVRRKTIENELMIVVEPLAFVGSQHVQDNGFQANTTLLHHSPGRK